jgi:hypothetical protein
MDSAHLRRGVVTSMAAYAVALQALLSAFAPIALAAPADPLAVLCTHDTDGSGSPARHDHPCAGICAAMGHGLEALTAPVAVAIVVRPQAVLGRATPADRAAPRLALRGPQVPRGPPLS